MLAFNRQSTIVNPQFVSAIGFPSDPAGPTAAPLVGGEQGRPIEVVSEFELRAALAEGFVPENILVNGPAKHHWLPQFDLPGLSVNLDSRAELDALLPCAKN
ncbi:MAG: hypothetical protein WDN00_06605 [Limisphaerales bacterium]